jgi:hypothetical protein
MNEDINYWVAKCASLQQEVDVLNEKLANASVIKWHTGEPKEGGYYLITTDCGRITTDLWRIFPNRNYWEFRGKFDIKAWCKLSDIQPYKEETK